MDTGATMLKLHKVLEKFQPASVKVARCAMFWVQVWCAISFPLCAVCWLKEHHAVVGIDQTVSMIGYRSCDQCILIM